LFACCFCSAQDWVHTGTNLGADRIRIAAADFKPGSSDPQTPALKAVFDATLYSDLGGAGIFDLVSKSMAPQASARLAAGDEPAAMVGRSGQRRHGGLRRALFRRRPRAGERLALRHAATRVSPQVLGKQYNEAASEESARTIAHRFADEIILRLGGGINGIAETKIYFISTRTGTKEVWAMDYDGQNQHAVTHLGTISISPRISPDNSRLAFASLGRDGWTIRMYSLELNRYVAFPAGTPGAATSPLRGRPMARRLRSLRRAPATRRSGWRTRAAAICTSSPASKGRTSAPTFNPRTGAQSPG
jgi:TolB protein